jgi:hypothetical protein
MTYEFPLTANHHYKIVLPALTRLRGLLKSTTCRLMGGHWMLLQSKPGHLALHCVACGHTSPGWEIGRTAR